MLSHSRTREYEKEKRMNEDYLDITSQHSSTY